MSVVALCVTRWSLRVRVGPRMDGADAETLMKRAERPPAARLSEIKIPVPPCQLAKNAVPLRRSLRV